MTLTWSKSMSCLIFLAEKYIDESYKENIDSNDIKETTDNSDID